MNYLEYYKNNLYSLGDNDCWTFVQDIFKKEQSKILPDIPIMNDTKEGFLKSNIPYRKVDNAFEGCLVYLKTIGNGHVGYAINQFEFIHKSKSGVMISPIPKSAEIYEILK